MAGGKMVTIDLTVESGRMHQVKVRGDFFIFPEPRTSDVIAGIQASLEGLPADLDATALSAHIAAAVPFGVDLLGTDPDAIAVATRRAVTEQADFGIASDVARVGSLSSVEIHRLTEGWKAIPWRLIAEEPLLPAVNVALDEVLTNRVSKGLSPPTLRFWRWSSPAIIVGRCQSVANEVDLEAAKSLGITVVRRMTGGGAMFLQPHGAITYSLFLPESALAGMSIRQSYEVCESWVVRGLRELGVDAHHVPINDIACSAGKIGGAAQARRADVVLHHTTMAYEMDPGEMVRVLRIGREKLKDKAVPSAQKRVSPLVQQTGKSREDIVVHLFNSFRTRFGGTVSPLTESERAEADRLVLEKYGSAEWTNEFE
jgi:lipoate-protein ligase A